MRKSSYYSPPDAGNGESRGDDVEQRESLVAGTKKLPFSVVSEAGVPRKSIMSRIGQNGQTLFGKRLVRYWTRRPRVADDEAVRRIDISRSRRVTLELILAVLSQACTGGTLQQGP